MRIHRTAGRSFALASAAALAGGLVLAVPRIASACTPTGLIAAKWNSPLNGDFGPCVNNANNDGAGGTWEQFEFGFIDWVFPETQAFGVWGLIANAWVTRYGGPPVTGQPTADEASTSHGALSIFEVQTNCSGPGEVPCGATTFIAWNPGLGGDKKCTAQPDNVCEVFGTIGTVWHSLPTLRGPVDEAHGDGHGHITQDFQGGFINWNLSNGGWCAENNDDGIIEFTDRSAC